ncbi:MAG: hypothetical protein M1813_000112 [Trichoglossum hirsutum]|nr:MAG: hypothetical protein M1813_000112 [Trichoglossum hirsutum]
MREADVTKALNSLVTHLDPYALNPQSQDRQEHLQQIYEEGATLKRHMQSHPSDWQFGSWDAPKGVVVFPSVLQDGKEVRPAEVP